MAGSYKNQPAPTKTGTWWWSRFRVDRSARDNNTGEGSGAQVTLRYPEVRYWNQTRLGGIDGIGRVADAIVAACTADTTLFSADTTALTVDCV